MQYKGFAVKNPRAFPLNHYIFCFKLNFARPTLLAAVLLQLVLFKAGYISDHLFPFLCLCNFTCNTIRILCLV